MTQFKSDASTISSNGHTATEPSTDGPVTIDRIARVARETIRIPLRGTAPLIVHKFSEKAKQAMLDAMQGRRSAKEIRNPDADFKSGLYYLDSDESEPPRYGFPVIAIKAATVGAARYYGKSVVMTELRQVIFMHGEYSNREQQQLVHIVGEPTIREDYVRVGQTTDLRYRPIFPEWSTSVTVTYVSSSLNRESLLSLVDAGGMGGIGEWRPAGKKSSGEFGTYEIDTDRDIEVIH